MYSVFGRNLSFFSALESIDPDPPTRALHKTIKSVIHRQTGTPCPKKEHRPMNNARPKLIE